MFQFETEVPAVTTHGAAADHFDFTGDENRHGIHACPNGASLCRSLNALFRQVF